MKEVSCQALELFFRNLPANTSPAVLAEGSGYPVEHLRNKKARIEWSAYVRVMANTSKIWSDEELVELGATLFKLPFARPFSAIARLLFTAKDVYRWIFEATKGLGNQVFTCLVPGFTDLGPDRVQLQITLRPGYEPCRQFFLVSKGSYIGMPLILGLPRAGVQMALRESGAVYDVAVPRGGALLTRLTRTLLMPFAALTVARELRAANETLSAQYAEIETARQALAAKNAELVEVNLSLEAKVKDRTLQLEESLRTVTDNDRQKTEFFANASHELRTPLTLMLAPLEIVASAPGVSEEAKSEIGGVVRSGYRLLKLVNDLLDLSKIEAGKMTLQLGAADLSAVVEQVVRPWGTALKSRKITLDLQVPATLPLVGDAERLEQVGLNLISNAVKFTPDEGRILVRAGRDEAGVFFSIENSGEGIEPDELGRLFGRFTQSTRSRSRRFGSTGLGLAVVRELVELHGGTIVAESEVGKWVRFTVRLPEGRAVEELGLPAPRVASTELRQYEAISVRENSTVVRPVALAADDDPDRATLLVAEDNEALRSFVVKNLSATFRIIEAGDGEQALRLARQHLPDVILSDLMMPGIDGLQLCSALKAEPQTAHIPFVLLTARADIDSRLRGLERGADDYLMKPFHLEELRARLRSQLRMRQLAVKFAQREKLAALGAVVAGVAHEIRNPLNGIINALEPLKELMPGASAEVVELIDLAIASSKRVEYVSDQLLKQGRAGEGSSGDVDLRQNVGLALQLLAHKVGEGMELSSSLSPADPVKVIGEAGALHQVWVNLIDNAIQAASPGGKGRVNVEISRVNGDAIVQVSDNGPGIEPRHLKRIFDPFFTTKDVGSGTGLGLAIVREIVEKHGGQITVDSRPGQGARFTVTLPTSNGIANALA